ncbi:GMP/IMP nucleotidase [Balneatrix alpica]|uniref:GMP/IMP nucleotidase n=1 Tax=Balneatrix alpica TaxID=75684 RepID=A0ABV5ZIE0_9GAMM|nr:GMP/IMP nucleotidase [Balneatrix alpica]
MLDWTTVDTVMLDMDGTLLDLHFDSYFWLEHLPRRYAELKNLEPLYAIDMLNERIMAQQGTLNWYCLDYWSQELGVDILALKREVQDKIGFRPQVKGFLQALRSAGIRTLIVTNCHPAAVTLKMQQTNLDALVDEVIISHSLGKPKEEPSFWVDLQEIEPFNPARTLFIDDSLPVLRSAQRFGIAHLLCIAQPDSQAPAREQQEFPSLHHFQDLLKI